MFATLLKLPINSIRIVCPPWEFPQMSIVDCGTCGSHVCTVKHTFRPHTRASLVTLCVLSKCLFTSAAAAGNSGSKDERRVTVENLRFSLLYICLSLSVSLNVLTPERQTRCRAGALHPQQQKRGLLLAPIADTQPSVLFWLSSRIPDEAKKPTGAHSQTGRAALSAFFNSCANKLDGNSEEI